MHLASFPGSCSWEEKNKLFPHWSLGTRLRYTVNFGGRPVLPFLHIAIKNWSQGRPGNETRPSGLVLVFVMFVVHGYLAFRLLCWGKNGWQWGKNGQGKSLEDTLHKSSHSTTMLA